VVRVDRAVSATALTLGTLHSNEGGRLLYPLRMLGKLAEHVPSTPANLYRQREELVRERRAPTR
jgi:hypothetical protein